MYELIYTVCAYLMGSQYWWVVGLALLFNYFIQRPGLILLIISPFVWADFSLSGRYLSFLRESFGNFQFFSLYLVSLVLGFLIYFGIRKTSTKINSRYLLLPILGLYLFIVGLFFLVKYHFFFWREGLFIIQMVIVFYSGAFVMMAFDSLMSKTSLKDGVESFLLLNTFHSSFLFHTGTQLGPNGTSIFKEPKKREESRYLRKKGIQVALLMMGLKYASDLIGYSFLGIDQVFFKMIHFPRFEIAHLADYKILPRAFLFNQESLEAPLPVVLFVRSLNWYFLRISHINFKILFLWMLGFYVKLGVDEPWKAKSFADFFRRTHVYVAQFYRTFVYPLQRPFTRWISSQKWQKYVSVWLMIFLGGIIFQSVSHLHNMLYWKSEDIVNTLSVRVFYDFLLATCVVLSLIFEKKLKPNSLMLSSVKFSFYIFVYSFLMSISASIKFPGLSFDLLMRYIRALGKF